jgi:tetrahydromethanopterin S-methyltransferase subunit G
MMEALKMERPMDNWNDDRLDELSRRMDEGFKEMREGFDRIDQRFETMVTRDEMKELIASINIRFDGVDKRFERVEQEVKGGFELVNQRIDRLYYALITALFGLVVSVILAGSFGLS